MQLDGASSCLEVSGDHDAKGGWDLLSIPQSLPLDDDIVDRAAEALYSFVFSGCDRLDGKHCWHDCDEGTKAGFRREAAAVLCSVWPLLARREN
jgi:hypothetical protein